ncbi:MAG: hypothetical protein JSS76_00695 [Bacteroidetes bacterium]|nr:hypothetical protein [Bacteroidota bacterium]
MTLKPVFVAIFMALSFVTFAQRCADDSLKLYPPGNFDYTGEGFADPNVLPCVESGVYSEIAVPFKVSGAGARFITLADSTTASILHIYSVRIDDVNGLPQGLCWTTRPLSSVIHSDNVGVLIIKGNSSAPSDSYPLDVTISIDIRGDNSYTYTGLHTVSYKAILGQPVVRIADSNGNCPLSR